MSRGRSETPRTIPEILARAAERFPGKGVGLFDGRGRAVDRRTYREVLDLARLGAGRLASLGLNPGEPVLVCLPTSWQWMEGWLGALFLGALPVAVAPAGALGSSEAHLQRLIDLLERLDARFLLTGEALCGEIEERAPKLAHGRLLTPEELGSREASAVEVPRPDPDEIAFLQLTSGSTGRSRAVMITHWGAVHNNLASDEAIGLPWGENASRWAEAMVSWLPLHHDMGLVGSLLQCMTCGLDLWLFNPSTFLARPRLWLEELGRRGMTFAAAPNFGYHLCAQQVEDEALRGLDLSGFRAAMVGAEMVRPETLQAFERLVADTGFAAGAFRPCYGLAEATLAVTFDVEGQGARTRPRPAGGENGIGSADVVSVGRPIEGTEIRITAPDGAQLPEGSVGEVKVQGPGVFAGYYRDAEATAETLHEGWLSTGDLGFLQDGELYLTGRSKDILIVHGHNIMPHEIEWAAESAVGSGGAERCGTFSVSSAEGEAAVLVVETRERESAALAALERSVRVKVARTLSLPLADVVLVRRGRIPKTTSGKVQRRELRRRYLDGELERLIPEGGKGDV